MVHEPLEADDGVSGSFNGPDPGNPCGWLTPEHVLSAIIDGNAFVNIHTENFRAGEIRGQVKVEDLEFEDRLDPGRRSRIRLSSPMVKASPSSPGAMAASATPSSGRI